MKFIYDETKNTVTIELPNGDRIIHPRSGAIFKSHAVIKDDGSREVTYEDRMLTDSADVLDNYKKSLIKGIENGEWDKEAYYSLVRYGIEGRWFYYPVPLLFASHEEQLKTAVTMNRKLQTQGWFRRKRNLLRKIAGVALGE